MTWRLALVVVAVLAAVALLLFVSSRGQQDAASRQHAVSDAPGAKPGARGSSGSAKPDTPAATDSPAANEDQPALGEIRLVGRLLYTPPAECEFVATLGALKATLRVVPLTPEGNEIAGLALTPELAANGRFVANATAPADAEPDEDPALLLTPKRRYQVQVDVAEGLYARALLECVAQVRGRIVDLGEVALPWTKLVDDDEWILTGRLLDPAGAALAHLTHLTLISRDQYLAVRPAPTDSRGRFVARYTPREDFAPRLPDARWEIDIAGTGYMQEETWRFADGLIELAKPSIDLAKRLIDFGDCKISAAFLQLSFRLSSEAQAALDLSGSGSGFQCNISVENGNASQSWVLRHDRTYIIPMVPGNYALTCRFDTPDIKHSDDEGNESHEWVLPQGSSRWEAVCRMLDIGIGQRVRLELPINPAREIKVYVETPKGVPEYCYFTLYQVYADGRTDAGADLTAVTPPITLRLDGVSKYRLHVFVEGYEPLEPPLPVSGNEMRLRFDKPYQDATLVVMVPAAAPGEEQEFELVLISLADGRLKEAYSRRTGDEPRTEGFRWIPPGKWRVEVLPPQENRFPGEYLCDPVEVELARSEKRTIELPRLRPRRSVEVPEYLAFAGPTPIEGTAHGQSMPADNPNDYSYPGPNAFALLDGDKPIERREEVDNGKSRLVLRMPVRVKVTIPEALKRVLGADWREQVVITCWIVPVITWCRCKEIDSVNCFWAPPGTREVQLQIKGNPVFEHVWIVEVRTDTVVELTAPEGIGTVEFKGIEAEFNAREERDRIEHPNWLLISVAGNPQIIAWLWYGQDKVLQLAPGAYELRANFGADALRPISFSVAAGETLQVHLPLTQPLACDGEILVNLPEGWEGEWHEWADVRPIWCAAMAEIGVNSRVGGWTRERIVDGKLLIENLPVAEALTVRFEFRAAKGGKGVTWVAKIDALTLTDSQRRNIEVAWSIED